ncbi:MAG: glutamate 5-kinase [Gammaproteobacteria bacterium]
MINRCVVKMGSALLTQNGRGLDRSLIERRVAEIAAYHAMGGDCVLVSSGAVAQGMATLGVQRRPSVLSELQALAAVGQMGLVQAYEVEFGKHKINTAQLLLTHSDVVDRKRYLNVRATLRALLNRRIVPIINENDSVATEEMCFGDNDTLGAVVTQLIEAPLLVILTDQAGLFDADPRTHSNATLIPVASVSDPQLKKYVAGSVTGLGRGGMITKLRAAELAAQFGAATIIADGREDRCLLRLQIADLLSVDVSNAACWRRPNSSATWGTLLLPTKNRLAARKAWLAAHRQVLGHLTVDDGAVLAISREGKSLLPVGVISVSGNFDRGEMVAVRSSRGQTIAHGLANYRASDAKKLIGISSSMIADRLGFAGDQEVIHRDNLLVIGLDDSN